MTPNEQSRQQGHTSLHQIHPSLVPEPQIALGCWALTDIGCRWIFSSEHRSEHRMKTASALWQGKLERRRFLHAVRHPGDRCMDHCSDTDCHHPASLARKNTAADCLMTEIQRTTLTMMTIWPGHFHWRMIQEGSRRPLPECYAQMMKLLQIGVVNATRLGLPMWDPWKTRYETMLYHIASSGMSSTAVRQNSARRATEATDPGLVMLPHSEKIIQVASWSSAVIHDWMLPTFGTDCSSPARERRSADVEETQSSPAGLQAWTTTAVTLEQTSPANMPTSKSNKVQKLAQKTLHWHLPTVGCWHDYLSGARCRFAYRPADDIATHYLLLQYIQIVFIRMVLPEWFCFSGAGLPGLSWKKGR